MKNIIVAGFILIFALPVSAQVPTYDVLTDPHYSGGNNTLLDARYKKWCVDAVDKAEVRLKEVLGDDSLTPYQKETLTSNRQATLNEAKAECREVKSLYGANVPKDMGCKGNYVQFGNKCITHDDNCRIQFGLNIRGESYEDRTSQHISKCSCTENFSFNGSQCVPSQPLVTGVTVRNQSIEQLQAMILQLTAMVDELMKQLNTQLLKNS